jgi:hypothetical protein
MCGCKKNKPPTGASAMKTARMVQDPARIPMKVKLKNFSDSPSALIGAKTKISYGRHTDGDELLVWKADVLAAPKLYEVLAEGGQPKK